MFKAFHTVADGYFSSYYTMLFMADVVGNLRDPKISPLKSLDTASAVHFAVYDKGKLQKLILLNTQLAEGNSSRSSIEFNVKSVLGSKIKIQRLTGPNSAAKTGVSWAGQTVGKDGKIEGSRKVERSSNGIVTLLASEAVVVERR